MSTARRFPSKHGREGVDADVHDATVRVQRARHHALDRTSVRVVVSVENALPFVRREIAHELRKQPRMSDRPVALHDEPRHRGFHQRRAGRPGDGARQRKRARVPAAMRSQHPRVTREAEAIAPGNAMAAVLAGQHQRDGRTSAPHGTTGWRPGNRRAPSRWRRARPGDREMRRRAGVLARDRANDAARERPLVENRRDRSLPRVAEIAVGGDDGLGEMPPDFARVARCARIPSAPK